MFRQLTPMPSSKDTTMRHRLTSALAAAAAICWAAQAAAGTAVFPGFQVSAIVQTSCDIGGSATGDLSSGKIDFGRQVSGDAGTQIVSGRVPVLCTGSTTSPSISFDYGSHASGSQRNLSGPSGALVPYTLLRGSDPGSQPWGDQSFPLALSSDGRGELVVYGRIPAMPLQTPDGLYSDVVTVRLDY
jgi:spore coat protein U-like protein